MRYCNCRSKKNQHFQCCQLGAKSTHLMIQQIITFAFASGKLRCGHSLYSSWFACIFHSFKIASYRKPEGKRICVCSQTLGAKKSNNPWHKEYKNGMFLSIYLRRLLKSKTIFKRALNFVRKWHFYAKNMDGQPLVLPSPVVGEKLA